MKSILLKVGAQHSRKRVAKQRDEKVSLLLSLQNFHFRPANRRANKTNNFHNNMLYVVHNVLPQKIRHCKRANAFM